jgi:hypothetical protein
MALSITGLRKVCLQNVVELKFVRRNKLRYSPTRRMLCTLDGKLLNSDEGKKILNFRPARYAPIYNAASKGLLTVWDIMMQDYRNIPVESVDIVVAIPTKDTGQKKFWEYFNKVIGKMSAGQKAAFMDK